MKVNDLQSLLAQRIEPLIDLSDLMQEKALDEHCKSIHAMAVSMEASLREVAQVIEKIDHQQKEMLK